jgi:hypothetical protein
MLKSAVVGMAGLLAVGSPALASDVVYQHTAQTTNSFFIGIAPGAASGDEVGNQITLAGVARDITSVQVRLRIGGTGVAQFMAQLRLYANDGPAGEPGTLLADTGRTPRVIDSGADIQYSFTVNPIATPIPDTLTWTVQLTDRSGQNQSAMGPAFYSGSPTVGDAAPAWWVKVGGAWQRGPANQPAFGARVVACYANCDYSTASPALNVADFSCFLQKFAAGEAYANCDQSTGVPELNVADFTCFLQKFAAGCAD